MDPRLDPRQTILAWTLALGSPTALADPQSESAIQEAKWLASDGAERDLFGFSVALEGDVAVVGATEDDDNGTRSGSAYVFADDGAGWLQTHKLTASDGQAHAEFGRAVAISKDRILIGASGAQHKGASYVYIRSGTVWVEEAKVTASVPNVAQFGSEVLLSGTTAVIGSQGVPGGAVFLFERSGSTWTQTNKLQASQWKTLDLFGASVALDEDRLLVGAPGHDQGEPQAGAAYVFEKQGTMWIETAKLVDPNPTKEGKFGLQVALLGGHRGPTSHEQEL